MLATNLKIVGVTLGTILFYTLLANAIPQVESEVPQALTLGANFTTAELVSAGEQLYAGAGGCLACHGTGTRAPNLTTPEPDGTMIGSRCETRVSGMSCKDYLHQSLVDPNAHVVDGYQPIMPDMSRTLSDPQIWALVAYMESLGGEVSVTAADIGGAAPAAGTDAGVGTTAGAAPVAAAPTTMEPVALLRENQCLVCHVLGDEGGPIGPPFTGLGARSDAASIRTAILDPNVQITPGYEAFAGTMPTTFGDQLTGAQLEAIVQYLATLR